MRRMLDPKTIGGGGGSGGEIHLYDVQFMNNTYGEFYLSFTTNKLLPGFTKSGDSLGNRSRKDYPEFFPKVSIAIPCSGAIIKENIKCPCMFVSIMPNNYDNGNVLAGIIYNNNITTTLIPTNRNLRITMRY